MRFVLYTEKTVNQCMKDIHNRMQDRPTAARPALTGWVDTGGQFSISLASRVAFHFARRTRLRARVEREGGVTVVRGYVPSGVSRSGQAMIFGALLLVGALLLAQGNAILAAVAVVVAAALPIPLTGDYRNSVLLLDELRKTLKARETPPAKRAKSRVKR